MSCVRHLGGPKVSWQTAHVPDKACACWLHVLPCVLVQTTAGARAGFFLGDGAGVGKGRQIAALIKEYWLTRKKKAPKRVLWVSTSTDLRSGGARGAGVRPGCSRFCGAPLKLEGGVFGVFWPPAVGVVVLSSCRCCWCMLHAGCRFDARRDLKDLRDLGSSSRQVVDHIHVVPKVCAHVTALVLS